MYYVVLPDGSILAVNSEKDREEALEIAMEEFQDLWGSALSEACDGTN